MTTEPFNNATKAEDTNPPTIDVLLEQAGVAIRYGLDFSKTTETKIFELVTKILLMGHVPYPERQRTVSFLNHAMNQEMIIRRINGVLINKDKENKTDNLTGINNRAPLIEELNEIITQINNPQDKRKKTLDKYVIAFVDLKKFKPINDKYGSDAGDQALIHAAKTLTCSLRRGDIASRWGGDEFVVLAKVKNNDEKKEFHKRIEDAVEEMSIDFNEQSISFGARVGLFEIPSGQSLAEIMNNASMEMNKLKDPADRLGSAPAGADVLSFPMR